MKWPRFKRSVTIESVPIRITDEIRVRHIIEKKPYPRPTRVWLTFRNRDGQIFQGTPNYIYGQKVMLYPVPLYWITGQQGDNMNVDMELNLEYDDRS